MQGGVGDGDAADEYGLQAGDGGNRTGAPDLHVYGFDDGQGFFGREFVGNRPARRAGDEAEFTLLRQAVDFDDHAVDFIGQLRAFLLHLFVKCQYFADIFETAEIAVGQAEAEFSEIGEFLDMLFRDETALLAGNGVGEKVQFALRGDVRIKLAQAAGGGIARIGKGFLPVFGLTFIERGEIGFEHQHFAAHFDEFGRIFAVQPQGDVGDGFDVLGNVFAGRAVAARRRLHQYTIAVEQADGEAVEFGFDNVFGIAAVQTVAHALVESVHFGMVEHAVFILRGKGVGQRQHRYFVAHFGESRQRFAADALGRAVGQFEFGMVSF